MMQMKTTYAEWSRIEIKMDTGDERGLVVSLNHK